MVNNMDQWLKEVIEDCKPNTDKIKRIKNIIRPLMDRLKSQEEEYTAALDEGFEEAYKCIQEEHKKAEEREIAIYKDYDDKLTEMKKFMVDKVGDFLEEEGRRAEESGVEPFAGMMRAFRAAATPHEIFEVAVTGKLDGKPTYEELEKRVVELEAKCMTFEESCKFLQDRMFSNSSHKRQRNPINQVQIKEEIKDAPVETQHPLE